MPSGKYVALSEPRFTRSVAEVSDERGPPSALAKSRGQRRLHWSFLHLGTGFDVTPDLEDLVVGWGFRWTLVGPSM